MSDELKAFLKGGLPTLLIGLAMFVLIFAYVPDMADRLVEVTRK